MAKRFIDTEIFNDNWFLELSQDGKIFWIYCITRCNHAGIIEINSKILALQTGVKSLPTVIKELGNRLVKISNENVFFIPKFISFQYPNFPNSKVLQQKSAIDLLNKYQLLDNTSLTLKKDLDKCYVYGNGIDNEHANDSVPIKDITKKKEFIIPTIEEFKNYFVENGYKSDIGERAWKGYDVANWVKSNGEKVRNWKQTCQQVWFKDEHKIHQSNKPKPNTLTPQDIYG